MKSKLLFMLMKFDYANTEHMVVSCIPGHIRSYVTKYTVHTYHYCPVNFFYVYQ